MPLPPVIALAMKEHQGTLGKRLWAGIPLWALKKGDGCSTRVGAAKVGAVASPESSMTFKTPAASSPTVVSPEAICYGLSVLQPRPAVASYPLPPAAAGQGNWKKAGKGRAVRGCNLHLPAGRAGGGAEATHLSQPSKARSRTSACPMRKLLRKLHLGLP